MTSSRAIDVSAMITAATIAVYLWLDSAWIGEDAHITFRTVENFVDGYGLRWNPDERVQTYTHPLWMFLISLAYCVTREFYTTVTALGILCSVSSMVIVVRSVGHGSWIASLAILSAIALSDSLVSFGTSGFENPLTLLLVSLFAARISKIPADGPVPWASLTGIAALAGVNRLDTILLFAPGLALLGLRHWPAICWKRVLIGFSPLFLWLGFSLFYYGFAYPNTAPAKLSAVLPAAWYWSHGFRDLLRLFVNDPASGILLAAGVTLALANCARACRGSHDRDDPVALGLGAGLLLYVVYLLRVGGDFVVGRFWTAPLWVSLVLLVVQVPAIVRWLQSLPTSRRVTAFVIPLALAAALPSVAGALMTRLYADSGPGAGRSMARAEWRWDAGWQLTQSAQVFRNRATQARRPVPKEGLPVAVMGTIGFAGLAAGRNVIIIDWNGLSDPLLARLRPDPTAPRIGHLRRTIPEGYVRARSTGSAIPLDPELRGYWEELRLVTQGPLWSAERLAALVRLNTGAHDQWLKRYEDRQEAAPATKTR